MRAVAQEVPAAMPRIVEAIVSPMMMVKRPRDELFQKRIIPASEIKRLAFSFLSRLVMHAVSIGLLSLSLVN
jgi:hypothetical protein